MRPRSLQGPAFWLVAGVLVSLARMLRPIDGGNHNTYLVRALGQLGRGHIGEDWLLSTPDPTPLFTGVAQALIGVFGDSGVDIGHALAMALYVYCLFHLAHPGAEGRPRTRGEWLFLLVGCLVTAKVTGYATPLGSGQDLPRLLHHGVAGQYIDDATFQPCLAGVFVLLALVWSREGRAVGAAVAAALAASLHPTYALPAALVVATLCVGQIGAPRRALMTGLVALICVAPIALYVVDRFTGAEPALADAARTILFAERIPHHARPQVWFDGYAVARIGIVALGLVALWRRDRALFTPLAVLTAFGVVGTIAVYVGGSAGLALLFPWRVSVIVVPVCAAVLLARAIERFGRGPAPGWLAPATVSVALLCALGGQWLRSRQADRHAARAPQQVADIARGFVGPGQLWVVPVTWEGFRIRAGVPVYADLKSHPFDAAGVVTWWRQIRDADARPGADAATGAWCAWGAGLSAATHVVVPSEVEVAGCGWRSLEEHAGWRLAAIERPGSR